MTLVEVVAGLALLGSLLSGILLATSHSARQARLAERRREAVTAADALLADWWRDARSFPHRASGTTADAFAWRINGTANPVAARLGGSVVRLELFDARDDGAALVSVEVVLPMPAGTGATR
jgi:type II secretory pathway pseudopilin PulG